MKNIKLKNNVPLYKMKWNELNIYWPNEFIKYQVDNNGDMPKITLLFAQQDCRTLHARSASGKFGDLKTIYETAKQISVEHQQIIKNFAKELSCFANINFAVKTETFLSAQNNHDHSLKVSICYVNGLREKYDQDGRAVFITEDNPVKKVAGGLIFLDEDGVKYYYDKGVEINNINTLKHELLHILGLGHPIYRDMQDQLTYRSILELFGTNDNLLYQDCLTKNKWLAPIFECYKMPVELTPVDVKGLIDIWGESQDNSEFCQGARAQFIDEYGNDYLL